MGSSWGAMSGLFPRQREQVLEVLQVLQERPQVALDRRRAALGQGEQVMPARFGDRLPVIDPGLVGGANDERCGAHEFGAALEARQRALPDRKEERFVAD